MFQALQKSPSALQTSCSSNWLVLFKESEMTEKYEGSAPRAKRGFAAMSPERQRQIARLGGRAAHQSGHAHEFTSAEARIAGKKRHERSAAPPGN
jgi:general stress protein YciG